MGPSQAAGPSQNSGICSTLRGVATDRVRTRSRERLERLAASHVSGEELQREVVRELSRVVGFDRWCWPSADPVSLLPGTGLAEHNYGPHLPRALEQEYSGADVATKEQAARGSSPAICLSGESGGDLARSPRWDETLSTAGIGDVAVLACRDQFGCWAWLEMYRDHADRPFSGLDLQLLAHLAPVLGGALRHRVTAGPVDLAGAPEVSGVLLMDDQLAPLAETPATAAWFALLPAAAMFASWGILPPGVYAAATRVR